MAFRIGTSIAILPLLLKRLPSEQMGVWYVFLAIAALNPVLDMGVSTTLARFSAIFWAGASDVASTGLPGAASTRPNLQGLSNLYAAAKVIYGVLAAGIGVLMASAGPLLVFSEKQDLLNNMTHTPLWWAYLLSCALGVYAQFGNTMLRGIGKVAQSQLIQIAANCLYLAVTASLVISGVGLASLVVGTMAYNTIVGLFSRRLLFAAGINFSRPVDFSLVVTMIPNTARMAFVCLGNYFISYTATVLSARHLSLADAASLGLSLQLVNTIGSVAGMPVNVRVPRFTVAAVSGDTAELRRSFLSSLRFGSLLYVASVGLLIAVGEPGLKWLGSNTSLIPTAALGFLCCYKLLEFVQNNFLTFVTCHNTVPFVWTSLIGGALTYSLGSLYVERAGLWGLLIITAAVQVLVTSWLPIWLGIGLLRKTSHPIIRSMAP